MGRDHSCGVDFANASFAADDRGRSSRPLKWRGSAWWGRAARVSGFAREAAELKSLGGSWNPRFGGRHGLRLGEPTDRREVVPPSKWRGCAFRKFAGGRCSVGADFCGAAATVPETAHSRLRLGLTRRSALHSNDGGRRLCGGFWACTERNFFWRIVQ